MQFTDLLWEIRHGEAHGKKQSNKGKLSNSEVSWLIALKDKTQPISNVCSFHENEEEYLEQNDSAVNDSDMGI